MCQCMVCSPPCGESSCGVLVQGCCHGEKCRHGVKCRHGEKCYRGDERFRGGECYHGGYLLGVHCHGGYLLVGVHCHGCCCHGRCHGRCERVRVRVHDVHDQVDVADESEPSP